MYVFTSSRTSKEPMFERVDRGETRALTGLADLQEIHQEALYIGVFYHTLYVALPLFYTQMFTDASRFPSARAAPSSSPWPKSTTLPSRISPHRPTNASTMFSRGCSTSTTLSWSSGARRCCP